MRIDVKPFTVVLRRFQQNVQIHGGICLGREVQSHRWPAVLMFDETESLFVQVVVDVNPFWVTGICHPVVADEDDIDDIGEIANLQGLVEVFSKKVNGLQRILFNQ